MDEWKWKKTIHPINQWKWQNHPSNEWMKMEKPSILWMNMKIYQSHEWMNEWKWKSIHPMNGWMKMEKPSILWMDEWKWKNHPSNQSVKMTESWTEMTKTIHPMNEWNWPNHPSHEWRKMTKWSILWMNLRNGLCSFGRPVSPIPRFFIPFHFLSRCTYSTNISNSLTFLFHPSIHSCIHPYKSLFPSVSLCFLQFPPLLFFSSSSSSSFLCWKGSLMQTSFLHLFFNWNHHPLLCSKQSSGCCDCQVHSSTTRLCFLWVSSLGYLLWFGDGFGHHPSLFSLSPSLGCLLWLGDGFGQHPSRFSSIPSLCQPWVFVVVGDGFWAQPITVFLGLLVAPSFNRNPLLSTRNEVHSTVKHYSIHHAQKIKNRT